MKPYRILIFSVLFLLGLILSLSIMEFFSVFMKPQTIGPYDTTTWHPKYTMFFSGELRVESKESFVVKNIYGEVVVKSYPEQIMGRDGTVYAAQFNATASEFYRINELVTVYSPETSEIYYFWDPFNLGWGLP